MSEVERPAVSAAQAARELATTLLDQADALDLHDLRATGAIEQVRLKSRALADAVHERGWGELFLGIDSMYPDEYDELDEFEDVDDDPDAEQEVAWVVEAEEDDDLEEYEEELLVPVDGMRVSYQARYDFVVTDPDALIAYARERATAEGADDVLEEIQDPVAAFQLLTFLDGVGSKEYDAIGLGPAGGEESQKEVEQSLWDLDPVRRDDTYPY
jgi:hypothetical protein